MLNKVFRGSFEHQLDDKNRIRIPSKFKKVLVGEHGERTYSFFRGKNGCICVMDDETLEKKLSYAANEPMYASTKEASMFFAGIFSAEEDAQGRVVLPPMLKRIAGIKKDIITVGHADHLEIWATERYYEYVQDVDYDSIFEKLRF